MKTCTFLAAAAVAFLCTTAWADAWLKPDELQEVRRLNPQIAFAKWAITQRLDKNYAAVTFQEVGDEKNLEFKGRKYLLAILHTPSKKVVLVLEEGTLEMGYNPHPVSGSGRQTVFGIGTDYFDSRRVEFVFAVDPPRILSKKELPPPEPDPDMP